MSKKIFKIQTFSVYISTTLVLLLFGTMCMLFVTAHSLSDHVRQNLSVSAIIDNKTKEADILKTKKLLEKRKYITKVLYISKEQVLEEQKKELGTDPVEFLGYNPYEASLEISVVPEYANLDSLARIEKELLTLKEIDEVIYHKELVSTINNNIHKMSIALLVLLGLLTLISWSLIGNMVRLSIYSQRFLLHTMKLVGATWGFIRRPFIVRNMYIGLFSGILANIILGVGVYFIIQREPGAITVLSAESLIAVACAVILFGLTITILCAYTSVNRFLRMRGNDLYFI
ncbi:MAG: permease-like cell division protein FtsX [Bacteroidaceae bacterium]|nr:permease-like cell division protein FtsX [Bacteroidaceae bacterium]